MPAAPQPVNITPITQNAENIPKLCIVKLRLQYLQLRWNRPGKYEV